LSYCLLFTVCLKCSLWHWSRHLKMSGLHLRRTPACPTSLQTTGCSSRKTSTTLDEYILRAQQQRQLQQQHPQQMAQCMPQSTQSTVTFSPAQQYGLQYGSWPQLQMTTPQQWWPQLPQVQQQPQVMSSVPSTRMAQVGGSVPVTVSQTADVHMGMGSIQRQFSQSSNIGNWEAPRSRSTPASNPEVSVTIKQSCAFNVTGVLYIAPLQWGTHLMYRFSAYDIN